MCDYAPGDNKEEPAKCSCWNLTMVGYNANQYWPPDKRGRPTGHHPDCQNYEMPPRFARAKEFAREVLSHPDVGAVSPLRTLAAAVYDLVSFLEREFPNAKGDGKS